MSKIIDQNEEETDEFECKYCDSTEPKTGKDQEDTIESYMPHDLKYFKKNHMKENDIIRELGTPKGFKGLREKTYSNLIIRSDYDFLENHTATSFLVILLITNIVTNFMFYRRYVYFSTIIDDYTFVTIVTKFRFILMISVIVISLLLMTLILLYYQSYLAKWTIYLFISEVLSILSILIQALWVSVFLMITFAVMFMIKIDLSNAAVVYRKKKSKFQKFAEKFNVTLNRFRGD